jgi:hypothetical protein
MNIRSITVLPNGTRFVSTDDNAVHRIAADAPAELLDRALSCGEPYPFTDDDDGNAVSLTT